MSAGAPITCQAVRRDASAFLDGRMSARERGNAQRHLRECATCMHELQQLARLSRAMHNLPPHRVADGMAQRLRKQHDGSRAAPTERAATQWAAPRGLVVTRRIAIAAALAATLPLVFWLGYRSGRAATPMPTTTPAPSFDDAGPLIADRAPAAPVPDAEPAAASAPTALQPRVRPATPQPEVVAAPAPPSTSPSTPDATLAGDHAAPAATPLPPPPKRSSAHESADELAQRMMEGMLRELIEQMRRR